MSDYQRTLGSDLTALCKTLYWRFFAPNSEVFYEDEKRQSYQLSPAERFYWFGPTICAGLTMLLMGSMGGIWIYHIVAVIAGPLQFFLAVFGGLSLIIGQYGSYISWFERLHDQYLSSQSGAGSSVSPRLQLVRNNHSPSQASSTSLRR